MLRKPVFWAVLTVASLGGVFFAFRYFHRAFPIVALDLRMNRDEALSRAREIAARLNLPPEGYREAASFAGEQFVQNFIELEAGGAAALRETISTGLYQPYTWTVRHFKPGETRETRLRFTPAGAPYGFFVKLPEDEPGPAIEEGRAREIAETAVVRDWLVDLSPYQLVESSREVRPGGRVDYTLVYERTDASVGEGRYRLRLVVSGDRLTELTRFVKVPEAFARRYEEMRSANNFIGTADSGALVVLYFIGGCGVGLFFLLRRRFVLWRAPLFWGLAIALLQVLAGINEWPLSWMGYDTAISAESFTAQRIAQLALVFLLNFLLFSVSFMAAESLSRRAFPNHIQQWRLWSSEAAASKAVLGRTIGGFLLVGLFFCYDVLLYLAASRALGWWTPSDTLVQPDILASYLPWLSPIAVSAQAGFWEESLFRAVPIAGAALLGNRFGRRKWWIGGALVLQALIFGAGHAGYMNQPAYARMVELIIPSFAFGALYLCFGLLPGIVLHFCFDVVWFAIPLFVSTAPGGGGDRLLVILLALVPLWVVLGARWRSGRWREIPESFLNRSWRPPEVAEAAPVAEEKRARAASPALRRAVPAAGLVGLLLWFFAGSFGTDAPPLRIGRGEALALARRTLDEHGVALTPPWQALAAVETQMGGDDRFVWQEAGPDAYRALMGIYLPPPRWRVRFVRFEGDVAQRAEEYQVLLSGREGPFRFRHILPEAAPGAGLPEDEARKTAHSALQEVFGLDPSVLNEISAVPSKLKARTDWVFTFADPRAPRLPSGEKRIAITIAGDRVSDAYRYVHTPEEWERRDRERHVLPNIINLSSLALIVLVALAGAGGGIVAWSRKKFAVSAFLALLAALSAVRVADLLNSLPVFTAGFSTAQPYRFQLFAVVLGGLLAALLAAGSIGLIAGFAHGRLGQEPAGGRALLPGVSLGLFAAGLTTFVMARVSPATPVWADYGLLGSHVPWLQPALAGFGRYLVQVWILLLALVSLDRFTAGWTRRKVAATLLLLLFGCAVAGAIRVETIGGWLIAGAATGALLFLFNLAALHLSMRIMFFAVATIVILGLVKAGAASAHPQAIAGAAVGSLAVAAAAAYIDRGLSKTIA